MQLASDTIQQTHMQPTDLVMSHNFARTEAFDLQAIKGGGSGKCYKELFISFIWPMTMPMISRTLTRKSFGLPSGASPCCLARLRRVKE